MAQRDKDLDVFTFQERFGTTDQCLIYLSELKWGQGFKCKKCGHNHYCKGGKKYNRQCTRCRYIESPTARTLFHGIKFPLVKAFYMVYFISTNKKGISSTELGRKLNLKQKVCWLFKRKVMKAMKSSDRFPLKGMVEVDESFVGGQDEDAKGRRKGNKKMMVVGIEKKGKGVSRFYARVIEKADAKSLGAFMRDKISRQAHITTDQWNGYSPLDNEFTNMTHIKSGKKGSNFPEMHRVIMIFKAWLRGMHHHVWDLQEYINEYTYRFNRSFMKGSIFNNLVRRMVNTPPVTYKMIIT